MKEYILLIHSKRRFRDEAWMVGFRDMEKYSPRAWAWSTYHRGESTERSEYQQINLHSPSLLDRRRHSPNRPIPTSTRNGGLRS